MSGRPHRKVTVWYQRPTTSSPPGTPGGQRLPALSDNRRPRWFAEALSSIGSFVDSAEMAGRGAEALRKRATTMGLVWPPTNADVLDLMDQHAPGTELAEATAGLRDDLQSCLYEPAGGMVLYLLELLLVVTEPTPGGHNGR